MSGVKSTQGQQEESGEDKEEQRGVLERDEEKAGHSAGQGNGEESLIRGEESKSDVEETEKHQTDRTRQSGASHGRGGPHPRATLNPKREDRTGSVEAKSRARKEQYQQRADE